MNYGMVLPPGHTVHVHRTNMLTKIYKIHHYNRFEDADGMMHDQAAVFGQTFDSVDVIDPLTGEVTHY